MTYKASAESAARLAARGERVTRIWDRGYVLLVRSPDGRYRELRTQADVKRAEKA